MKFKVELSIQGQTIKNNSIVSLVSGESAGFGVESLSLPSGTFITVGKKILPL